MSAGPAATAEGPWSAAFGTAFDTWAASAGCGAEAAGRWRERLVSLHAEPHRRYHTGAHVLDLLRRMERLPKGAGFERPGEAAATAFWHDAIYRIGASDNEEASARLAVEALDELGFDRDGRERVASAIRATATHEATGVRDVDLFLDLDMAVLGDDPEGYALYRDALLAEYVPAIPLASYAMGRIALFIDPTLARERIFLTAAFADREAQSRENLGAERAWLEATARGQGEPDARASAR